MSQFGEDVAERVHFSVIAAISGERAVSGVGLMGLPDCGKAQFITVLHWFDRYAGLGPCVQPCHGRPRLSIN